MNYLTNPAVNLMNRLKYKNKFALLGIIAALAVGALTYQLVMQSREITEFSKKEVVGVYYIMPMIHLMKTLQQYREPQLDIPNENNLIKNMKTGTKTDVDNAFKTASQAQNTYGDQLNTSSEWNMIKGKWDAVPNKTADFAKMSEIVNDLQKLIVLACDNSNLTLDPDINTYYLMDNYCNNLPSIVEQAAFIRDIGTKSLLTQKIDPIEYGDLLVASTIMDKFNKVTISGDIDKVLQASPQLTDNFRPLSDSLVTQVGLLQQVIDNKILKNDFAVPPQQFYNQTNAVINTGYQLIDQTGKDLLTLINIRVDRFMTNLYLNLSIAVVSLLLLLYLCIGIYQSIIQSVKDLVRGTAMLAKGDLTTTIEIHTNDELSQVAGSFNHMRTTLENIVSELQLIVRDANEGNLSKRIQLTVHHGFGADLSRTVNDMCDTFQSVISDVNHALDKLSAGNLTQEITDDYKGDFGDLKTYMNLTIKSLEKLITNIKHSTKIIYQAAQEISKGSFELAKRTEQEAAFLEETSASIEELTITVKHNAENAKQANELAQTASQVAVKGGEVVTEVIHTMSSINDSSRKVADIISVIDSIAFQTNILALNAAVEAARAGEQGRGFAVVATEVRNLAQRTLTAAKEIKSLISTSVENVSSGTTLVSEAGQTMDEILKAVHRVAEIMQEFSTASVEQSNGIEQVNIAIAQMDKVTQQNNAMVEQAAETARSLELETQHMDKLVNIFIIKDQKESAAPTVINEKKSSPIHNPYDKSEKETWSEF